MIRIQCSAADAYLLQTETLTAGMVNLPVVKFEFSSDWDGLGKTAVVRAGELSEELLIVGDQIIVPASCMVNAGVNLIIGVYGGNASVELPTVWCACGEILDGTDTSFAINHTEASTSEVAQMLSYAQAIEQYAGSLEGNVIRSVYASVENNPDLEGAHVYVRDTGVRTNRSLTFEFVNINGVGVDSVTFQSEGENRGKVQVRLTNNETFEYDGIKDALDTIDDIMASYAQTERSRNTAEANRVTEERAREQAETQREANEQARQSAEGIRERRISELEAGYLSTLCSPELDETTLVWTLSNALISVFVDTTQNSMVMIQTGV